MITAFALDLGIRDLAREKRQILDLVALCDVECWPFFQLEKIETLPAATQL